LAYYPVNEDDQKVAWRAPELLALVATAQKLRTDARQVADGISAMGLADTAIKFGLAGNDADPVNSIVVAVVALADGTATEGQYTALNLLCETIGR
jgi:hypothetical protein